MGQEEGLRQKELRDRGEWYYDAGTEMIDELMRAKVLCYKLNQIRPDKTAKRQKLLKRLLGSIGENTNLISPFHCDYGYNITIGENCLINYNAVFLDCGKITIGDHVLIAPNAAFYTIEHQLSGAERRKQLLDKVTPIVIEDDVWIGGNVTILPGVTIGKGSVIGAGSVVTKSIPAGVVAVGNPCKVLRKI